MFPTSSCWPLSPTRTCVFNLREILKGDFFLFKGGGRWVPKFLSSLNCYRGDISGGDEKSYNKSLSHVFPSLFFFPPTRLNKFSSGGHLFFFLGKIYNCFFFRPKNLLRATRFVFCFRGWKKFLINYFLFFIFFMLAANVSFSFQFM